MLLKNLYHNAPFIFSLICIATVASILGWMHPELVNTYGMHRDFIETHNYGHTAIQIALFQFFHGSILHLLSNVLFLVLIGVGVEIAIGVKRMIALFIVSTFSSIAFLYAFSGGVTIGISTFCMAILGYFAMSIPSVQSQEFKSAMMLLFLNIAIGFTGNISLSGHLGGAVWGIVFYAIERMFLQKKA